MINVLLFVLGGVCVYCLYMMIFLLLNLKNLHTNVGINIDSGNTVTRQDWIRYNDYVNSYPLIMKKLKDDLVISDRELNAMYGPDLRSVE